MIFKSGFFPPNILQLIDESTVNRLEKSAARFLTVMLLVANFGSADRFDSNKT
jgi:hypothetical protein